MRTEVRSSARPSPPLAELWRYRELLRSLVVRNLKAKYQRSSLGFLWTLLNPLLVLLVLVTVFTYVIRLPIDAYWAFLISGYFAWNFTSQMLNTGTYILAEHGRLSRAVAFPAEVPIIAAALTRLIEFGAEMSLVLILLFALHLGQVPATVVLLPVLLVLLVATVLGFVLPLAVMAVFFHDVEHAVPVGLTLLFYISPVFYPVTMVPEGLQQLYMLNPLAGLLTLFHVAFYEGVWPSAGLLLYTSLTAAVVLPLGYAVFNRYKYICAELV